MSVETRCLSEYKGQQCARVLKDGKAHRDHLSWNWAWPTAKQDAPWMPAGRHVCWAFEALSEATTIGEQGRALNDLADAVNDLSSFITEFNINLGLPSIYRGEE